MMMLSEVPSSCEAVVCVRETRGERRRPLRAAVRRRRGRGESAHRLPLFAPTSDTLPSLTHNPIDSTHPPDPRTSTQTTPSLSQDARARHRHEQQGVPLGRAVLRGSPPPLGPAARGHADQAPRPAAGARGPERPRRCGRRRRADWRRCWGGFFAALPRALACCPSSPSPVVALTATPPLTQTPLNAKKQGAIVVTLVATAIVPLALKPGDDAAQKIFSAKQKAPLDKEPKGKGRR